MDRNKAKQARRDRRRRGLRKRVIGTPDRPRLSVRRSLNHVYTQVIDDLEGRTIVAASTREPSLNLSNTGNVEAAKTVGQALAERAKASGVQRVVFDRGGYRYHGRVRAVADAAREGGLQL